MFGSTRLICAMAAAFAAQAVVAGPIAFENFTPIAASVAAGSRPEATPFQLASSNFSQRSISVNGAVGTPQRNGDNWDMITLNENGAQAGRYLFSPYETGTAGVRRVDLVSGTTTTIVAPGTQGFVSGDASRWTPFGTYLTAEESWASSAAGATMPASTKGRLFEITNPLAAAGSVNFVQRNVIPHVSHEGLAFDKANNMYFIDELNGGAIYKYTSATPNDGATFFSAGQTFALKVGAGGTADATGAATWVAITNATGGALDPSQRVVGSTDVDGRAAAIAAGASKYNRPEDLEIQTLANGDQILYFNATDPTGKTFSINLSNASAPLVKLFADRNTLKTNTGVAVGSEFFNPDNLAIDANGNIYIVEDQPGGVADIWFAYDADRDGIAESLARWATMSTLGAEPTGLYFSPFDANVAFINVQHADSDFDRTIQITAVSEPASVALMMAGLGLIGGVARRRKKA